MRVVVGKKDTPTPIFNDDMTHIVFAPYWNVPPDIVEERDGAVRRCAIRRSSQRTNMEVLDKSGNPVDPAIVDLGRSRRLPLPAAARRIELARARQVHVPELSSTSTCTTRRPTRCSRARPARSATAASGVEQPEKLAQYVLADQPDWTAEQIDEAMHGGRGDDGQAEPGRCRSISGTGRRGSPPTASCSSATISTASTRGSQHAAQTLDKLKNGRGRRAFGAAAARPQARYRRSAQQKRQSSPAADRNRPVSIASASA